MKKIFLLFFLVVVFTGCATVKDVSRNFAGTSTRDLEAGKADSVYQVYSCSMADCFAAVTDVADENNYYTFMQDEARGLIVIMNIPGCVDTTEVGIFFTALSGQQGTRIELSSRSSPAKKEVAKVLFSELNDRFKK